MKKGRFIIYSVEMGNPIDSPYHRTDDQEEAEIVCRDLANNNKVVVFIFDCKWTPLRKSFFWEEMKYGLEAKF